MGSAEHLHCDDHGYIGHDRPGGRSRSPSRSSRCPGIGDSFLDALRTRSEVCSIAREIGDTGNGLPFYRSLSGLRAARADMAQPNYTARAALRVTYDRTLESRKGVESSTELAR